MNEKFWHTEDVDLTKIKDSMELNSGTELAILRKGDYTAELRVCGEVKVIFKGEYYTEPESFPDELKAIVRNGHLFDHENVYVCENNWFELFVDTNGTNISADVVDVEGYTWDQVEEVLEEFIEDKKVA